MPNIIWSKVAFDVEMMANAPLIFRKNIREGYLFGLTRETSEPTPEIMAREFDAMCKSYKRYGDRGVTCLLEAAIGTFEHSTKTQPLT